MYITYFPETDNCENFYDYFPCTQIPDLEFDDEGNPDLPKGTEKIAELRWRDLGSYSSQPDNFYLLPSGKLIFGGGDNPNYESINVYENKEIAIKAIKTALIEAAGYN